MDTYTDRRTLKGDEFSQCLNKHPEFRQLGDVYRIDETFNSYFVYVDQDGSRNHAFEFPKSDSERSDARMITSYRRPRTPAERKWCRMMGIHKLVDRQYILTKEGEVINLI